MKGCVNNMAKLGVIGDKDSVMLFQAVGLDVYYDTEHDAANRRVLRMAKDGYAVIYVTEKVYALLDEALEAFAQEAYPAIIPIPDSQENRGIGMAALKQNVEKAVGVDILFSK